MAFRRVEVEGQSPASPDAVWAVLRDFCGAWHPLVLRIEEERDLCGSLVRAFAVRGEPAIYRERLTWFSDSDRSLGYTHVQGIAEVERYDAWLEVFPAGDGSRIVWNAEVSAPEGRLGPICDGTGVIFEQGITALSDRAAAYVRSPEPFRVTRLSPGVDRVIDGQPRLSLTAAGGPGKRLCLFLHGIGGGRGNWDNQVAAASGVMPAAALDLRGYGGSDIGPAQSTVDDYCDDIRRVMREFDAERLVLVGLSYGSWIATSFAMRHPHLLDGLVLSGGCTGMSEAGPEERERFRTSREVPLDAGQTPRDFAPGVVQVLAGPNATDTTRQALFDSMAVIPAATYRDALTCFTTPPERFDFAKLDMPVLMMTGEHDRLAPPAEIRGVAQRIHAQSPRPDVRFEVIPNAGHVCNVEQPGPYNRHLTDFLRRLP